MQAVTPATECRLIGDNESYLNRVTLSQLKSKTPSSQRSYVMFAFKADTLKEFISKMEHGVIEFHSLKEVIGKMDKSVTGVIDFSSDNQTTKLLRLVLDITGSVPRHTLKFGSVNLENVSQLLCQLDFDVQLGQQTLAKLMNDFGFPSRPATTTAEVVAKPLAYTTAAIDEERLQHLFDDFTDNELFEFVNHFNRFAMVMLVDANSTSQATSNTHGPYLRSQVAEVFGYNLPEVTIGDMGNLVRCLFTQGVFAHVKPQTLMLRDEVEWRWAVMACPKIVYVVSTCQSPELTRKLNALKVDTSAFRW